MSAIVLNFIWKTINSLQNSWLSLKVFNLSFTQQKKLIDVLQSHISSVYFPCQTRVYHAFLV